MFLFNLNLRQLKLIIGEGNAGSILQQHPLYSGLKIIQPHDQRIRPGSQRLVGLAPG